MGNTRSAPVDESSKAMQSRYGAWGSRCILASKSFMKGLGAGTVCAVQVEAFRTECREDGLCSQSFVEKGTPATSAGRLKYWYFIQCNPSGPAHFDSFSVWVDANPKLYDPQASETLSRVHALVKRVYPQWGKYGSLIHVNIAIYPSGRSKNIRSSHLVDEQGKIRRYRPHTAK